VSDLKLASSPQSGLVYRYREGDDEHCPPVLMLHGLGGDENSMWILEKGLLSGGMIVAPRAKFKLNENGYSWVKGPLNRWPTKEDFSPAVTALKGLVRELVSEAGLKRDELFLMGFSQGAALAFSAAADPYLRPKAIITAAGFLPQGDFMNLSGLPIFWGHGSKDEWIPIEQARSDAILLRDFGADIRFCETNVGHKLSMECIDGLRNWMEEVWTAP
jgi:phospholipase/carboxylesterase